MSLEPPIPQALAICPRCSTHLGPMMLSCPGCGRLVHSDRLQQLADTARSSADQGDIPSSLAAWREALDLLPTDSRQYQTIAQIITDLVNQESSGAPRPKPAARDGKSQASKAATGLGTIGLLLWKFKALLLGLTKAGTFFSMLLSMGVYSVWGWKFAVGLVLSIYVHEMGHVIALRRLGFKATSPMFIPGLGAFIRLKQRIVNPREDAIVGLAGPIYGLGAAIFTMGLWYFTKDPALAQIAKVGAFINLFNLVPVWTLDGARGFHAMSRLQKWLSTLTVATAWYFTRNEWLALLGILCAARTFADKPEPHEDWKATIEYSGLVIALTSIAMLCGHLPW